MENIIADNVGDWEEIVTEMSIDIVIMYSVMLAVYRYVVEIIDIAFDVSSYLWIIS